VAAALIYGRLDSVSGTVFAIAAGALRVLRPARSPAFPDSVLLAGILIAT